MIKYWENGNISTQKLQSANSIHIYRISDISDTADTTVGPTNFFGCSIFSEPTFTNINIIQSTHNTLPLRVGHTLLPIKISIVYEWRNNSSEVTQSIQTSIYIAQQNILLSLSKFLPQFYSIRFHWNKIQWRKQPESLWWHWQLLFYVNNKK
jgi:hypothetical protein